MKKFQLLLTIILSLTFIGCSSNEYKDISLSKIQRALAKSNLLTEETSTYDILEESFFNDVDELIEEGFIIKPKSKEVLEDVVVIKADLENIDEIFNQIISYKQNIIINTFISGENSKIAANTIAQKKGQYIYLISAKNATEIENIILNLITN
jgi:AmiR/NasT family two-component response regulator